MKEKIISDKKLMQFMGWGESKLMDYNMLFKIVSKIENLGFRLSEEKREENYYRSVFCDTAELYCVISVTECYNITRLKSIYESCVNFILWYNEKKKLNKKSADEEAELKEAI
jgi:hypothetical protein